jgi:hypothetical protein
MREVIPLKERPLDIAILVFFLINLLFITYIVDLETLVVRDPYADVYPIWPPKPAVDVIHWYGDTYDPVLMARPVWWKATIWIDALLFGPFYVFAIYAYIKGKEWIRIPSIIYASILWTNVTIILSEEIWGPHASPQLGWVLLANAAWFILPLIIITRMWRAEHPFTREVGAAREAQGLLAAQEAVAK